MAHMGKATINIPHVTWRAGKPRFIPGPELRAAGHKGENLRHPPLNRFGHPVGPWFTLEECLQWSEAFDEQLESHKTNQPPRARRADPMAYTIANLVEDWLKDPRLNGKELRQGKKVRPPLKTNTVKAYRKSRNIIRDFDSGYLWQQPAAALSGKALSGIIDRIEQNHGLAQARAIRAALSSAYGWGIANSKVQTNPVRALAGTLPTNPERIRFGTPDEMRALIAAADAIGLPELADSYTLGLWTGQRQNDRLSLEDGQITDDGILFRQSKKHGQPLLIPAAPELAARLKAARKRREDWRVNYMHVILDEQLRRPFDESGDRYRKLHQKVRKAAVAGIKNETGDWLIKPHPSLADFRDQDLRDTAVTWLALADCDLVQITSITGHTLASAQNVLKHYLGIHPDMARTAIGKLVKWHEGQSQKTN